MAIKKEHTINVFGENVVYKDAYHQVESIIATNETIKINIRVFNNDTKSHSIDFIVVSFDETRHVEPDLIQLAYQLLKDTPEYSGSFDVFEDGQPKSLSDETTT